MDKLTTEIFLCADQSKYDITLNFAKELTNTFYNFLIKRLEKDGYIKIKGYGNISLEVFEDEEEFEGDSKSKKRKISGDKEFRGMEGDEEMRSGGEEQEANNIQEEEDSESFCSEKEDPKDVVGERAKYHFELEIQEESKKLNKNILVLGDLGSEKSLVELRKLDKISTDTSVEKYRQVIAKDIEYQTQNVPSQDVPNKMRQIYMKYLTIANQCKSSKNMIEYFSYLLALTLVADSDYFWQTNINDFEQRLLVQNIMRIFSDLWAPVFKSDISLFGVSTCGCVKSPRDCLYDFFARFSKKVCEYCNFRIL